MLVYLCQCSSGLPARLARALSGEHQSSPSLPSYTADMDQGELLFPIELDQGEDREVATQDGRQAEQGRTFEGSQL